MNALTAFMPASIVATHFGVDGPIAVPFTGLKMPGSALPEANKAALRNMAGQMVFGVEHSFYVIPDKKWSYKEEDLLRLGAFIAKQDLIRGFTSPLRGGFEKPVAYIARVHPANSGYAYGKRWAYLVPLPDGSVRKVMENSLEKLLTRLGRE